MFRNLQSALRYIKTGVRNVSFVAGCMRERENRNIQKKTFRRVGVLEYPLAGVNRILIAARQDDLDIVAKVQTRMDEVYIFWQISELRKLKNKKNGSIKIKQPIG